MTVAASPYRFPRKPLIPVVIIPARGGSTRIKRKNLELVGNKSLLQRACEQASATGFDWVVSTDDAETAMYVHHWWGDIRIVCRTGSLVGDGPMALVLRDAWHYVPVKDLDCATPWGDACICLQPTSPLRHLGDILSAWAMFEDKRPRSLVTVNQATGKRNGAVYITSPAMLNDDMVFDDDSLKYPMPASRSLDINTPADLEEARRILGP